ncbi:MAG: ion transporter [Oscillospiraceae bacterium]|nr:ion transporter [Oscillospiraceae bacterium]
MEKLKKFAESTVFQTVILGVIIFNAVLLGLQTVPQLNEICGEAFRIADYVCLGIFIVEMILKLIVYRFGYFKDGWNWFDFIIILTSLVSDLAVLSAFRVFRIFRVFRSLKALRSLKRKLYTAANRSAHDHLFLSGSFPRYISRAFSASLLFCVNLISDVSNRMHPQ